MISQGLHDHHITIVQQKTKAEKTSIQQQT